MAGVEYDLDTSGGLMPEIQALLAPPSSDESKKPRREKDRISISYRRPGRAVNHDCCDSCKEGGDLICCDNCPAAFHLQCHDPPLDEDDLPTGEWLCHCCRMLANDQKTGEDDVVSCSSRSSQFLSSEVKHGSEKIAQNFSDADSRTFIDVYKEEGDESIEKFDDKKDVGEIEDESPLQTLIRVAALMNPKQFQLPNELQCTTVLPGNYSSRTQGCNKRLQKKEGNKTGAKKLAHELDNGIVPLPAKLCFECRKSCLRAPLIQCDFCPLLFHQDCLDPPLTTLPTGRWMCPNHVENILDQKLLTSNSLTERVKLWNRFTGSVSQDVVKIEFLKKIHRQHPPFRYKIKLPPRNRVQVPDVVKMHYRDPPKLLPRRNEMVSTDDSSSNLPSSVVDLNRHKGSLTDEQETWLSNVVSLQTSIARLLMQKKSMKNLETNRINGGVADSDNLLQTSEINSEDNFPSENPVVLQQKQQISSQQSVKQTSVQRIVNGDVHLPNSDKSSSPEASSKSRTNSLIESSTISPVLDSKGCKYGNVIKSPALINVIGTQGTEKCVNSASKMNSSNCDTDLSNKPTSLSFSTFEGTAMPKYTLATRTAGSISTNPTYVLQVKPPNKHQTSSNCSELLTLSKLSSINSVPVKPADSLDISDSAKLNHLNNLLQTSIDEDIDLQLDHLDEKLVYVLAYQRLQQLQRENVNEEKKMVSSVSHHKTVPVVRSRAALSPLNRTGQPAVMTYRVFSIGTGDDMDLTLNNYGHCNFVSTRHACIFYDEMTKQFELLNYSEHGTTVDNVMYSCDFSDKSSVVSSSTSVVAAIRTIIDKYRGKSGYPISEKLTMAAQLSQTSKPCNCKMNNFNLSGGNGAGWEGTAVLHHGSVLRFGCLYFIFSITENATREALLMVKKPDESIQIKTDAPQMLAVCNSSSKQMNNKET